MATQAITAAVPHPTSQPSTPEPPRLLTWSNVSADGPLTLWRDTLSQMALLPNADQLHLPEITEWITSGVQLDLVSVPPSVNYSNTMSVLLNADLVRTRLHEYMEFGAVIRLPTDAPCPFGIQPLHVIIKPDKKPRLVIDLSRNLNSHLRYEYFSYSSVRDAAELSTPGCWYGKLDLSNCFTPQPGHTSYSGLTTTCISSSACHSDWPRHLVSVHCCCQSWPTGWLSTASGHVVRYLDDFLFVTRSRAAMTATLPAGAADVLQLRPGDQHRQDGRTGPAAVLPGHPARLGAADPVLHSSPPHRAPCSTRSGTSRATDPSVFPRLSHRQAAIRSQRTAWRPTIRPPHAGPAAATSPSRPRTAPTAFRPWHFLTCNR